MASLMSTWQGDAMTHTNLRTASHRPDAYRPGFTLIELLTVLVVIGIILALLIPAVQQARESARRVQCTSKIRQLGVALHQYHDVYRTFPAGLAGGRAYSAFMAILPYIEQAELYSEINFTVSTEDTSNQHLRNHSIALLGCPSGLAGQFPGSTNYVVNGGTGLHVSGRFEGIFAEMVSDGQIAVRDVTDGLSQTAAVSEVIVANRTQHPFRAVWEAPRSSDVDTLCFLCDGLDVSTQTGNAWERGWPWTEGNPPSTMYNHAQVPNRRACTNGGGVMTAVYPAASNHPGGVNVCLADGSTRFVSDRIDRHVWRAVGTRRSGDTTGEF